MLTFITGRERSRVHWVPSRLGSQNAGPHGRKKYSSDLPGSTEFHGVRGTRANIAVPDRSIRLRGSARLDAGRILLTWGICTRRAGKRYRAHSRLAGWLVNRTRLYPNFASRYSFESSRRDLHNTPLCTALRSHVFQKISRICQN